MTEVAIVALRNAVGELVAAGLSLGEIRNLAATAALRSALDAVGGNQCQAARILRLHRNTMRRQLEERGVPFGREHLRKQRKKRASAVRNAYAMPREVRA